MLNTTLVNVDLILININSTRIVGVSLIHKQKWTWSVWWFITNGSDVSKNWVNNFHYLEVLSFSIKQFNKIGEHSAPRPHQKQDSLAHSCTLSPKYKTNQNKVLLTTSEKTTIIIVHILSCIKISAHIMKCYMKNQILSTLFTRIATSFF